jgi:hypothetical protein
VSMSLFEALSHIQALTVREVRHEDTEHFASVSGRTAIVPRLGTLASIHVRFDGSDSPAAVATISRLGHGIDVAEEITWWMSRLRATTAREAVTAVLAKMPAAHLALLTVALDAVQARGQVPEYRSPADVERIAELERLLADRA